MTQSGHYRRLRPTAAFDPEGDIRPFSQTWSLTTLREKLVKIGAKVVRHGRYVTFQLAGPVFSFFQLSPEKNFPVTAITARGVVLV